MVKIFASSNNDVSNCSISQKHTAETDLSRYELKIDQDLVDAVRERNVSSEVLRWKGLGRVAYVRPSWSPAKKAGQQTKVAKLVSHLAFHRKSLSAKNRLVIVAEQI
jgi:hypothetical protein